MKRPGDLVTVRCGPRGHWLAALYRGTGGGLWLRYDTRQILDPETFAVIPSPRPGGYVEDGTGYAPFIGTRHEESWLAMDCGECALAVRCGKCAGQYPMFAAGAELLVAADAARTGKPRTVIAVPTAVLREKRESQ